MARPKTIKMDEYPAYFPTVSLHLSRTLDEIGLNTLAVKRRRNTILYTEQMESICSRLDGKIPLSYLHFGSQAEGTTTPGLNADLDTLICFDAFNVIQSWAQWEPNKENYMILQEDTAPGYCRLQLLRQDIPMAREDLPRNCWTYDSKDRVILPNESLFKQIPTLGNVRNGPARSEDGGFFSIDKDYVLAFRYSSWPEQAKEFIRRRRLHGWPSPRLVQEAIKHGVFLVPVGYKLSPTEHLEWRISASMTERCLMFSLGMVHIKCYVVLKLLIKTFVQPFVGKCISSYHCKTALLHCTENTDPGSWREDNLLQCVTQCLVTLLTWVNDGFCPQFIIFEENLFAGKVTAQNRDVLKSILSDLIKSKGRAILRVEIDDINRLLQSKLNTRPSVVPVLDTEQTVRVVGKLECQRYAVIDDNTYHFLVRNNKKSPILAMRWVCEQIEILKAHIRRSEKHERQAIEAYIAFLTGWLGSMMTSFSLSHKRPVPRKALRLLRTAAKCDVASALKLASVCYSIEDLRKVEMVLQQIEDHLCRNEIQPVCACYPHRMNGTLGFFRMMYELKEKKPVCAFFAHCVRFSPQEIHCAPTALRNELHKSAGDDVECRDPKNDKWMCLGTVDCLPFLHYLQFLTYTQLGRQEQRQRALHNLEHCLREDIDFSHLETAWNLLGQCMEMQNDPNAAMQCYRTSLEIRPRNNAANWHVQNLRCSGIQKGRLLE